MPRHRNSPQIATDLDADVNGGNTTERVVRRSTRIRRTVMRTAPYDIGGGRTRRQVKRRTVTKKTVIVSAEPERQRIDQEEAIFPTVGAPENLGAQEIRNPLGLESEDVEPMNPARGASSERENLTINTGPSVDIDQDKIQQENRRSPPRTEGDDSLPPPADEDIRVYDSSEDLEHERHVRPDIPVE